MRVFMAENRENSEVVLSDGVESQKKYRVEKDETTFKKPIFNSTNKYLLRFT